MLTGLALKNIIVYYLDSKGSRWETLLPYTRGRHLGLASERTYTKEAVGSAAIQPSLFRPLLQTRRFDRPDEQLLSSIQFVSGVKLKRIWDLGIIQFTDQAID